MNELVGLGLIVGLLLLIAWPTKPYLTPAQRRFPLWAHEAADTKLVGPKGITVLMVGVVIWIGAQLAVKYFADHPAPPTPVMNPACAEAARLAAHGAAEGPSYARARDACTRAGG